MATYAVGDLQGCCDELIKLLDQIGFTDSDTLWLAGDLVNRGPKSLEALRLVHSLGDRARCVLGNHDLHLLALHTGAAPAKKHTSLHAILKAPDRDELMNWLLTRPLLVEDNALGYVMTHAGIPHIWSLDQARTYAQEIEQILQSDRAKKFFRHMYGNHPDNWSDDLAGWDRIRAITNYLTRMRFIRADGTLDFSASGGLDTQPEGFLPWFQQPRSKPIPLKQLFGHWAALDEGATDHSPVTALDTGCVWGNRLTAMRLDDGKMYSCQCQKHRKPA